MVRSPIDVSTTLQMFQKAKLRDQVDAYTHIFLITPIQCCL